MQKLLKNWVKHIVAILILLVATVVYFSPSVIDGKVLRQGDNIKATGMGASQMKQYEETAQPENSVPGRMPCSVVCLMWLRMEIRLPICLNTDLSINFLNP